MIDKIEKALIDSAIRIVKDGEGCLYVIKLGELSHEPLVKNDLEKFSIFEESNQKRMDILAKVDGACIIDKEGYLIAYGQKINDTRAFDGYGTRHSAGFTATLTGNISILGSQESKKVKIFKNGQMLMQLDILEKDIEKRTGEAANLLESIGAGAGATILANIAFPIAAVAIIPGILIFGSSHFIIKTLLNKK
jgi:DNA integrity scanning protein DisA with diadenylate cyclase activity